MRVSSTIAHTSKTMQMYKNILIAVACLMPLLSQAGVYQWVDENGQVQFGDVPPQQQSEYKVGQVKLNSAMRARSQKKLTVEFDQQGETIPAEIQPALFVESAAGNGAVKNLKNAQSFSPVKASKPSLNAARKRQTAQELEALIKRLRKNGRTARQQQPSSGAMIPISTPTLQAADVIDYVKRKLVPSAYTEHVVSEQVVPEDVVPISTAPEIIEQNSASMNSSDAMRKASFQVESENVDSEKDADKCGVFTGFVISYEMKVADECPGAHCAVYKGSLRKYLRKQARYC